MRYAQAKYARYLDDDDEVVGKVLDSRMAKRLAGYLRPHIPWLLLSILILIIQSGLELLSPQLEQTAIDKYISEGDIGGLAHLAGLYLGVIAGAFLFRFLQSYLTQFIAQRIMYDLRMEIFSHLHKMDSAFFDRNPVGRLMTRVTNDVEAINNMLSAGLVTLIGDFVMLFGIVTVLLIKDWRLALVTFSVLPLVFLATGFFRYYIRKSYRWIRGTTARLNAFLQENVSGVATIQAFTAEKRMFRRFDEINADLKEAYILSVFCHAVFFPVMELISSLAIVLIIYFGGVRILGFDAASAAAPFTIGLLWSFRQYVEKFFGPIRDLSQKFDLMQDAMASSERIFRLLDTEPAIVPPENGYAPERVRGEIEFQNVDFEYREGVPVLHDVSFRVEPGQTIALVGATGSGKTTITSLLCRFYDVTGGRILVDGVDVREWDLAALRRSIGVVLQDVFLFSGDITRNITLGNADVPYEEMVEVSKYVNAHTFIRKLSRRYEEPLVERGNNLSVGQKQLLSFARALVSNPAALVLDEATSSVDTETEQAIQEGLARMLKGRTSIVVAHRLSTIRRADQILVIHHGRIRERGTHEELLEREDLYYRLYQLQYKDQDLAGEQGSPPTPLEKGGGAPSTSGKGSG
jgi:ATP-binding cassette subfamily B protein